MKRNKDMYNLYEQYKETMAISKKTRNKRQKMNREIREKHDEPYKRRDHVDNVNDITHWNSMIRDLEEDMKMIEMYLDFEDRYYLHKEYNDTKSMIYNQNSYEGMVPLEEIFGESTSNINVIYTNELQREIVILLNNLLTRDKNKLFICCFDENDARCSCQRIGSYTTRGC